MNILKEYIGNMEKPQGADDFLANMASFFTLTNAKDLLANPDMMEAVVQFLVDIPHYGLNGATENFFEILEFSNDIDMNPCELCGDYYPDRMMADPAYCQSCVEDMEWD